MIEATTPVGRRTAAVLACLAVLAAPGLSRAQEVGEGAGPADRVEAMRAVAWMTDESGVNAEARVEDGVLAWGFEVEGRRVRYRIRHTGDDGWHEVGEYSPDGSTWHTFLEMTLHRAP